MKLTEAFVSTQTIGQVARQVGIGVETVRFYERQGLIDDPPRTPSGYRLYPPETIDRLRFIRRAKQLGFSLDEISELLGLGGDACSEVRALAAAKVADIEQRVADLERMAAVLRRLVASCDAGIDQDACPILEALCEGPDAR